MNQEKIGEIYMIRRKHEMIREAIEHMWKDHRKVVIGAGVVLVILIIAAL